MSFVRNVGVLLLYINSLSYALQCTTNCSFQLMLNAPYEIPADCDKTESAKICEVRIANYYRYGYSYISLSASSSNTIIGDLYYVSIDLSSYGQVTYSVDHQCKNKDDCAREFALTQIPVILNRPPIDFVAMRLELLPLLSSNLSVETNDLACFDSNENVRQCAIAKKPGVCQVSYELTRNRKPTRSCDRESIEYLGTDPHISMFDLGNYASFNIKCNRSLCNGPVTSQLVKEIVFKYNITKTIEGRLNHGLCLSLSSIFLIFNIILLSSF